MFRLAFSEKSVPRPLISLAMRLARTRDCLRCEADEEGVPVLAAELETAELEVSAEEEFGRVTEDKTECVANVQKVAPLLPTSTTALKGSVGCHSSCCERNKPN